MTLRRLLISMDELNKLASSAGGSRPRSTSKRRSGLEPGSSNPPFVLEELPEAPYSNELQSALDDLAQIRRFPFIRKVADSLYVIGSGTFPVDSGTNSIGWRLLPYRRLRDTPENILLDHASMHENFGTVVVHLLRAPPGSIIAMWVHRVVGNESRDIPGKRWRLTLDDSTRGWHPDRLVVEIEPISKPHSVPKDTDWT